MYIDLPKEHTGYYNYANLPITTKAYWAGLLDGEGCLRFDTCSGQPLPSITLAMTCQKTVQAFCDTFGANIKQRSRNAMKDNWKDCYTGAITTHNAAKVCEVLYPLMITKQDIAKEMAEFYVHKCIECGAKFWSFGVSTTCSENCRKKLKSKYGKEYRKKRAQKLL